MSRRIALLTLLVKKTSRMKSRTAWARGSSLRPAPGLRPPLFALGPPLGKAIPPGIAEESAIAAVLREFVLSSSSLPLPVPSLQTSRGEEEPTTDPDREGKFVGVPVHVVPGYTQPPGRLFN
jgi:hypothetical protein